MPSFDIISEVDEHELSNAVDNANRAISQRFDLKGTTTDVKKQKEEVVIYSESDFQVDQVLSIVHTEMVRRGIDINSFEESSVKANGRQVEKRLVLRQGIDKETAKKIVKLIKDSKIKVQASIQGEQVRVTGKKRDDLQSVMSNLKQADLSLPLQYTNFRD
ncbi:MAG: YajQ family cyclic di-GMP-binding protein [Pseudomonadota bacterium]